MEKIFDKSVKVPPKTKLKGVRKAILEELGLHELCTARLYAAEKPKDEKKAAAAEESKDEGGLGVKPADQQEELVGEMASLETLGLAHGGKVEVEVFMNLEVSVQGKGAGYLTKIEVGPEETMDMLETRVSFFKMFMSRNFQVFAPDLDRTFEGQELQDVLFRDSKLKNGSKLQLREPVRIRKGPDGEPLLLDDDEEGEDELMEEGGEEGEAEIEDMDEEAEADLDDNQDASKGGEDAEQPAGGASLGAEAGAGDGH